MSNMNEVIYLQSSFYNMDGILSFYLSKNVIDKSRNDNQYKKLLDKLIEELEDAKYISVIARFEHKQGEYIYVAMTKGIAFRLKFGNEGSLEKSHSNLIITSILSESEYRKNKKYYYGYSPFTIFFNEDYGVVIMKQPSSYEDDGIVYRSNISIQNKYMDDQHIADLRNDINYFFSNEYENTKQEGLGRNVRNFIERIKSINDAEYDVECAKNYESNYVYYDSRDNKNNNDNYIFYSSSFDPDNEEFSVGTFVEVETNEETTTDEKKKRSGLIVDRIVYDNKVAFEVKFNNQFHDDIIPNEGKIVQMANKTQKRVRDDVIQQIKNHEIQAEYLYDFLGKFKAENYEEVPDWDEYEKQLQSLKYPPTDTQMQAIKNGIETKDIQLVLGPPGTGKTTVITKWVEYFISHGKRILISSQNNAAVDNVLANFADRQEYKDKIVRIGNSSKIQSNCLPFTIENKVEAAEENYSTKLKRSFVLLIIDLVKLDFLIKRINELNKYLNNKYFLFAEIKKYQSEYKNYIDLSLAYLNKLNNLQIEIGEAKENYYKSCLALKTAKAKNIIWKFIYRKHLKVIQDNLDVKKQKIIYDTKEYNDITNRYNQIMFEFKELLNDENYCSFKIEYKNYLEFLSKTNLNIKLCGPISAPKIDMRIFTDLNDSAYEELSNYLNNINRIKDSILAIIRTLNNWNIDIKNRRNEVITRLIFEESKVVGATCIGINSNRLTRDLHFDVSIIDECGQIQIQNVIVPMSRSPKTLMLGDHKQIPPMVQEEVCEFLNDEETKKEYLEKSFFQHLFEQMEKKDKNTKNIVRLNRQFRMPGVISDVIADWFYENNYYSGYSMDRFTPVISGSKYPLIMVDTSNVHNRFETEKSEAETGYANELEADIIGKIIKNVVENNDKITAKDLGIISAYGRQVRLIREKIRKYCPRKFPGEELNDVVSSLDSFQGQERNLIIYSMTRSRNNSNEINIGFMSELRRLNVAFTRCKKQLVIIGDFNYLTLEKVDGYENMSMDELEKYSDNQKFSTFMAKMIDQAKNKNINDTTNTNNLGEYLSLDEFKKEIGIE